MSGANPSQILRTIPVLIVACFFAFPAHAKYSGGTGEPNDPYQIATAADLIALGETPEDYDKHFVLTADIDLDPKLPGRKVFDKAVIAQAMTIDERGNFQGTPFTGVFDGKGHRISHLTIMGAGYLGLFGQLGSRAMVKDLGLVDGTIAGTASCVGGLVGSISFSSDAPAASVTNCYSTGVVSGRHSGGLVGSNEGVVSECYSTAALMGTDEAACVGGLVGNNGGIVTQCYSTGLVVGNGYVGGLVGSNGGSVLNSVWDMETSGLLGSSGGVGLTTAEMMDPYWLGLNGFADDPNWVLDAGRDYPRLAWEGTAGDIIPAPQIDWLEGNGTADEPYRIDTAEQLVFLGRAGTLCDRHFILGADIDLDPNLAHGQVFPQAVIPVLAGVFDGRGHSISHLTIKGSGNLGLFGQLASGAEVRNLGVVDVNIAGSGAYAGGLAGSNSGTVSQCYSTGAVAGGVLVGGLVGLNGGTVTQCHNTAAISGWSGVGGLVGVNLGTVSQCCSTGAVISNSGAGGLVAANLGTVSRCYSTGAVSGKQWAGGLVGWNLSGTVTQCYSTGRVVGEIGAVGGLIGYNDNPGMVRWCFWNVETSGQSVSAGGFGMTTAELQQAATFAGWGVDPVWTINEGKDYPRLVWERKPGEIITTPGGGNGTAEDPYQIGTAAELILLGQTPEDYDKHFVLIADIDLDPNLPGRKVFDKAVIAPGELSTWGDLQGSPFTGVFDGNGHTISHLTIRGKDYLGLFGQLGTRPRAGEVRDLGVVDVIIVGSGQFAGGLIGWNRGMVTNCHSSGMVNATRPVGGLVGCNGGTVTRCYSTCAVAGTSPVRWEPAGVGGLVGYNDNAVTQCYSTGAVSGGSSVGGLVGMNLGPEAMVNRCYSTGLVTGGSNVGGLAGSNGGDVTDCYSVGPVLGDSYVGGLVGANRGRTLDGLWEGTVTHCYSAGAVTGTGTVGGLVGYGWPVDVVACFWDIETSGQTTSSGGEAKTTAQMQAAGTFGIWGVCASEGVWTIDDGNAYPRLRWEERPGQQIEGELSEFLTGTGTQDDPWLIYTPEQLYMIGMLACEWDKHFRLMADIDLSRFDGKDGRPAFRPIGKEVAPFTGAFDGNGHVVSHLTINGAGGLGLFAVLGSKGEIRDVGVVDVNIAGSEWGAAGGVVAINRGSVTNCHSTGTISNSSAFGGTGGLVGSNGDPWSGKAAGTITGCSSTCTVSGHDFEAGGLVGTNGGLVTRCYSTGAVSGGGGVGGLVGYNLFGGTVTQCYSTGAVTGSMDVGGLVGDNYGDAVVTGGFWDTQTSGQTTSAGGTGKTTVEMQTAKTFLDAGWDFVGETKNGTEDIWWILEGKDYPRLWWELPGIDDR